MTAAGGNKGFPDIADKADGGQLARKAQGANGSQLPGKVGGQLGAAAGGALAGGAIGAALANGTTELDKGTGFLTTSKFTCESRSNAVSWARQAMNPDP